MDAPLPNQGEVPAAEEAMPALRPDLLPPPDLARLEPAERASHPQPFPCPPYRGAERRHLRRRHDDAGLQPAAAPVAGTDGQPGCRASADAVADLRAWLWLATLLAPIIDARVTRLTL